VPSGRFRWNWKKSSPRLVECSRSCIPTHLPLQRVSATHTHRLAQTGTRDAQRAQPMRTTGRAILPLQHFLSVVIRIRKHAFTCGYVEWTPISAAQTCYIDAHRTNCWCSLSRPRCSAMSLSDEPAVQLALALTQCGMVGVVGFLRGLCRTTFGASRCRTRATWHRQLTFGCFHSVLFQTFPQPPLPL
jgi:hypothetical protein